MTCDTDYHVDYHVDCYSDDYDLMNETIVTDALTEPSHDHVRSVIVRKKLCVVTVVFVLQQ